MAEASRYRPPLGIYLSGFVLLTGVIAALILIVTGEQRFSRFENEVLKDITAQRAQAVSDLFARALWRDWRDVQVLADASSLAFPSRAREVFDQMTSAGERISWAGLAQLDGTVVAASDGLLENESMALRPWFTSGLKGPYAGDVHEEELLARLIAQDGTEIPRFIDLSAPVTGLTREAVGVVGIHISLAWARDFLAETAAISGVEAMFINRDGAVVIGPADFLGKRFELSSFGAAEVAATAAVVETWPDGKRSLSVVIPHLGYRDLPVFSWSLVARVDPQTFAAAHDRAFRSLLVSLGVVAILLAAAVWLFVRIYLRPIGRLALDAERISRGEEVYPRESRRTIEHARLSGAVARLQSQQRRD